MLLLKGALQRHVGHLQLAGAVRGDVDEVHARVMCAEEAAEWFAFVHRPHI